MPFRGRDQQWKAYCTQKRQVAELDKFERIDQVERVTV
jgi:hypothetical protein